MRTRIFPETNYKAVFINGITMRFLLDNNNKNLSSLEYPEFYDVALNTLCYGACKFCYTSATHKGINFSNVIEKIKSFFGNMTMNQRPFQVALGGAGEPTLHPEFCQVLKAFHELDIVPNYTTNGMHLTEEVIEYTKKYSGGVALSLHPHLHAYWKNGVELFNKNKIRTNAHIIISDKESIDFFKEVFNSYDFEKFVLLPYRNYGFAQNNQKEIDYDYLEETLDQIKDINKIAFGAYFYDWIMSNNKYNVSVYPPEQFSKYLLLDDNLSIFPNSFDTNERNN